MDSNSVRNGIKNIEQNPRNWKVLSLDRFLHQKKCLSCSSNNSISLPGHKNIIYGRRFPSGAFRFSKDLREKRQLKRCLSCGLIYQEWVPSKELLLELYSSNPDDDGSSELWRPDPRRLTWDRAKKFLPKETGKILDVGANDGYFLSLLPCEWEKFALEPTKASNDDLRKVVKKNYEGFIDDSALQLPENEFDVVCLFDVAEHFYNVMEAMTNVSRCLRPGGIVILETGCTDCVPAQIQKSSWWYYDYIEHLVFFNRKSLKWIFAKSGLEIEFMKIVTHTKMGNSFKMGKDLFKKILLFHKINAHIGVDNEGDRIYLENPLRVYWPDHIFVVARKKQEK